MPFSPCNAPGTFQMLTEFVLAGLQWQTCLVYLDNVIVYGQDFDEHLERFTNPRVFTITQLLYSTIFKPTESMSKLPVVTLFLTSAVITHSSNQINHGVSFDAGKAFSHFYDFLNVLVNKHAPLKTVSDRMLKQFSKPWISSGQKKINQGKFFFNRVTLLSTNVIGTEYVLSLDWVKRTFTLSSMIWQFK